MIKFHTCPLSDKNTKKCEQYIVNLAAIKHCITESKRRLMSCPPFLASLKQQTHKKCFVVAGLQCSWILRTLAVRRLCSFAGGTGCTSRESFLFSILYIMCRPTCLSAFSFFWSTSLLPGQEE